MIRSVLTYLRFLTLGLCLMCMACSPRALREAQRVVTEADSLREIGQTNNDSALLMAANTFEHRMGYTDELAKCYYYLGRNCTRANDVVSAVQYYIKGDRLLPSDYALRGRLNSNMANICAQINQDSIALIFDSLSSHFFYLSGDTMMYAYSLLNVCRRYTLLEQYERADDIWQEAAEYHIDNFYSEQLYRYRASLDWHQGNYDAALQALRVYPRDTTEMHDMLSALVFDDMHCLDSAVFYAKRILAYSNRPSYHVSAYFILEEQAKQQQNVADMDDFFHKRQDADSITHAILPEYVTSVQLLRDHLAYPAIEEEKDRTRNIIYIILACIAILAGLSYLVYMNHSKKRENHLLHIKSKEKVRQIYSTFEQSKDRLDKADLKNTLCWNNDAQFLAAVDFHFLGFAHQVQKINPSISVQDIKLYVLVLLNYSQAQMADLLGRSTKSMKNLKQVAAGKLGVSSLMLRPKLLDIIASFEAKSAD